MIKKFILKTTSILCMIAFLTTGAAYPAPSALRARSFADRTQGRNRGVIPQQVTENVTRPSAGTFPLMIPATIDKLTDMLKPLYPPDEARRLAVEAIEKNGIEVPRRGIGNVVAAGSFSLNTQPDGNVYVASTVTSSGAANPLPADAAAARDFVEAGLEWLTANQAAMPVIREALTRVSSAAKEVTIDTEYRDDHDRLMNLAPFSVIDEIEGARRRIIFDTDVPAVLNTPQNREGLTLLFAMGIMHQCFIISGMRPEGALLRVLAFYEGLGEERQGKLLAVLGARDSEGNKVVDNADDFARFLTRGAGAPEIEKQHQAALILKLERVERAYNYRQVSADLFDEAGNPRMIELGLAKMRELAHGDVSPRTYSNAIEELAAWRVASEMQEGGIELVMGFLGRAGLVEQLLMAAAENVPTAELKKPFADLSRCFKSQRFSAVVTPELKRLEARWKAAGAPLARLTDLVNKPQVPLPQLRGAVREFQDALDAFLTDARRTMREVAERKQAVIIAERKADEEATGKSPNTGRSATFEQLQADLAVISEAVDNFTVATFSSLEHPAGRLPSFNKVWNVVMQRLISNETLHLVLLNELLDPYGGKTRDFRELLLAGKSLHVTSNLGAWLSHVTHCIQALPAYAWYDIIDLPGDNYEIMAACKRDFLEVMFKGNIEAIAEDIEDVMHSEHVAIARSILARRMNLTGQIDRIVEALKTRGEDVDASREEAIRLIMDRRGLREAVENLATLVEATYGNLEEEIGRYMVNNGVERVVALDMIIHENNTEANLVRGFCAATPASDLNGEATRQEAAESVTAHQLSPTREIMKGRAFLRRRDLPCFHNLTTLGPGETTTFLKTWLETGLSLHLFCQDNGLEDRVKTRLAEYNSRMGHAAWRVIEELGMQGLFFKEMAQKGLDPTSEADRIEAAPDFIAQYPTASIEVGRICAIMEYEEKTRGIAKGEDHFKKEPVLVAEYLKDKRKAQEIENQANEQVVAQYDYDHGTRIMAAVKKISGEGEKGGTGRFSKQQVLRYLLSKNDADHALAPPISEDVREQLREERDALKASLARQAVVNQHRLQPEAAMYNRLHTVPLARYTAQQEVVSEYIKTEKGGDCTILNRPKYRYEAQGPYRKFGLLYTPSRVDLGEGERHSVEGIGKVVTAEDQETLNRGSALYDLFNMPGTVQFPRIAMGEFFKARENFFTRGGVFYLSLGEGINIDAMMLGDQEMYMRYSNLRGDRIVLPTGESYRGFCVPKEFFLIYAVMIASTNGDAAKKMLMAFAPLEAEEYQLYEELIDSSFESTNTATGAYIVKPDSFIGLLRKSLQLEAADMAEWEQKASDFFAGGYHQYFNTLTDAAFLERMDRTLPALNDVLRAKLPRLAQAFHDWGITMTEGEIRTRQLLSAMCAWANKKLQGLEQINRMGPYRALELERELVEEARERCRKAGRPYKENDSDLVKQIGGPYKAGSRTEALEERPITDARLSVAADELLITAGVDDKILGDLDPEGRKVAKEIRARIVVPGSIRIAGTVTSNDIVGARQEINVSSFIDKTKAKLARYGIIEDQLRAYCETRAWGAKFWLWPIPAATIKALRGDKEFMRLVHLAALDAGGVIQSYAEAAQGCDIFAMPVADPELLDLMDNLPEFVGRSQEQNPNGLIVVRDGQVGARPRTAAVRNIVAEHWVKGLFAIEDTAVYGCLGLGKQDIAQWRREMETERQQAQELYRALCIGQATGDYTEARRLYRKIAADVKKYRKAEKIAAILAFGAKEMKKLHPYFDTMHTCLANVNAELPLDRLDFGTWLALGGRFLLNGHKSEAEFNQMRAEFEGAVRDIPDKTPQADLPETLEAVDVDAAKAVFFKPKYVPKRRMEFGADTGKDITVGKTQDTRAATIGLRLERDIQTRRELMVNERRTATNAIIAENNNRKPQDNPANFNTACSNAMAAVGSFEGALTQEQFSRFLYWTQVACLRVIDSVIPDTTASQERLQEKKAMRSRLISYLGSGTLDPKRHKAEIIKDLSRLVALESERLTARGLTRETATAQDRETFVRIAEAGELLDMALLMQLEFDVDLAGPQQERYASVDAVFEFFDQTLNVHDFDYFPFSIQPALGEGAFDNWYTHDEKFQFAGERHHRLYARVRKIICERTPMADRGRVYQDEWLGDVSNWGNPAGWRMGLGVNVDQRPQQYWFSYSKLRDAVTMMRECRNLRNPSNMAGLPEIFLDVDPALLGADENGSFVNVFSVYNQGNTTMPVAVEQGATLERNGINLMLCQFPVKRYDSNYGREVLQAEDAVMYVSAERYKKLLMASGVDETRASEIASRVPAQGVMVAIKFKAPQAVRHPDGKMAQTGAVTAHGAFFHFTQALRPEMDSLGIALIQPIPYEAMTYLKGIVPGVLRGTRVAAPAGFTWSMEDTRQAAAEARARLYQEFGAMPTDEQVEQEVKKSIRQKLWAMLEKYPYVTEIIEKPEKESGGRGAELLPILSRTARAEGKMKLYGSKKETPEEIQAEIEAAVEGRKTADMPEGMRNLQEMAKAIYEVSLTDNVVVQSVVYSQVRMLFTHDFLEEVVRERAKKGESTSLDYEPQTPLFQYFRYILIRGTDEEFRGPESVSSSISVIGTRPIGNVAGGSILDVYRDDIINPEFRTPLRRAMDAAYYESMSARREYLRENWPHVLKEYLALHRRFGTALQTNLAAFMHGNSTAIVDGFFAQAQNAQFAAQRPRFEVFFNAWIDRFLSTDESGRDFTEAMMDEFGAMTTPFITFLGSFLEDKSELDLDIHYSMDDAMAMYLGDDKKNYRYIVARDENGNIRLDDWGNMILLPLAEAGRATGVQLYDQYGHAIEMSNPNGTAKPVPIFDIVGGQAAERELYDRDVLSLPPQEREKFRVSCIQGVIIEFNPGAGLWRPYDEKVSKLTKDEQGNDVPEGSRAGEGVKRIFTALGAWGREVKEQGFATASFTAVAMPLPSVPSETYMGAGDAIFTEKPEAKPGTVESFIDIGAAKAREDMNKPEAYAFNSDDMGLVLTYAALEQLTETHSGTEGALAELTPQQVLIAVNAFLTEPQVTDTLARRLNVSTGVQVTTMVSDPSYRESVAGMVYQCCLRGKEAVGLRITARPLSDDEAAEVLGNWQNCGLVFEGAETLFGDIVAAFQIDADRHFGGRRGLNFIGVRRDWLTPDGAAVKQALVVDANGLARKVVFTTPVRLQAAAILQLNRETELTAHEQLSDMFNNAGIPVLNPYGTNAAKLDSKDRTHNLCAGRVIQPAHTLIKLQLNTTPQSRKGAMEDYIRELLAADNVPVEGRKKRSVVIQPDHGTEGQLAKPFALTVQNGKLVEDDQFKAMLTHLDAIMNAGDDTIVRETRGNITCNGGKRVVFRLDACETEQGYRAETGFAMVAGKAGEVIISRANAATIEDINNTLLNLEWDGKPLRARLDTATLNGLINQVAAQLKETAAKAAAALGVKGIIGVDLLLEAYEDRDGNLAIRVVFLEANPRPALLQAAKRIVDDFPPGVAPESQPLIVNPAFYDVVYRAARNLQPPAIPEVATLLANRPAGQARAIAEQINELSVFAKQKGFITRLKSALGVAGGRLRRLMMHPDMGRFFGPALQEPIGARETGSRDQIAVLVQETDDGRIYVDPENPAFGETRNWISADMASMYPGPEVATWADYERAGSAMTREILESLGYAPGQITSDTMRRPIPLVANVIASLRTLRAGPEGERVQQALGRNNFRGLRICINGDVPRGGFSSSSAVVVAVLNAINALYDLRLSDETIVDIACQAEYGTGVKAGSLDQTAIEKGKAGQSMLISSNPRERYATMATFGVNTEQFGFLFPFSVARDRETAQWSNGIYAPTLEPGGKLTSGAVRKMTGKSAEIAAILLQLPLDIDFFQEIQEDLVSDGELNPQNLLRVYQYLRQLPELIPVEDLRNRVAANRDWYVEQLKTHRHLGQEDADAEAEADRYFATLFDGWQEPIFSRSKNDGVVVEETGVPLRAMVAYLYGEEAKNLYLLRHPDASWLEYVSRSQLGDRSFDIDFNALPEKKNMVKRLDWEAGLSGPQLMAKWLEKFGAKPFNYNKGLSDAELDSAIANIERAQQLHLMQGSNFFRGLALIDLIEAMLKKAFGDDAVAVRINAAGQGDFFQIHFDVTKVSAADIESFMEEAVYKRFGLNPEYKFVEVYSGGPAVGVALPELADITDVSKSLMQEAGIVPTRMLSAADRERELMRSI